jgi:hypothetical protein
MQGIIAAIFKGRRTAVERKLVGLEASSALNQVNNQDDDRDYEQGCANDCGYKSRRRSFLHLLRCNTIL